MLIIRRDLETILEVLNRFGLHDKGDGVTLHYTDRTDGYDLSIEFTDFTHDVACRVNVDIGQDTLGEE